MLPSLTAAHNHARTAALPQSPIPKRSQLSGSLRGANDVLFRRPFREERAADDGPIASTMPAHQFQSPTYGKVQASPTNDWLSATRRDIDPLQPGFRIAQHLKALWRRVDIAGLHPLVPRPPGLGRQPHPTRHASTERSVASNFIIGAREGKLPPASST